MSEYISDYELPVRYLNRIDELANEYGAPTLRETYEEELQKHCPDSMELAGNDTTFSKALRELAKATSVSSISDVDDDSFFYMDGLLDAESGKIAKNRRLAVIRFGSGTIAVTPNTRTYSISDKVEDMSVMGVLVLACALKMTQHGNHLLLRYNDLAMMSNPAFSGSTWEDGCAAKLTGDMWQMFSGALLEMRSPVLDISDNTIVSLPFYKFRNLNECDGYRMDDIEKRLHSAKHIEYTDKMDGSFVQMRYVGEGLGYEEGVLLTTSGSICASTNEHLAFARQAMDMDGNRRYADMCKAYPDYTFIFEMIIDHGLDPHIVSYDEEDFGLYLIARRNIADGTLCYHGELEELGREFGVPVTRIYDGYDMERVLEICHSAHPFEREGFVLNVDGYLVKIKLDEFLTVSKLVHGAETHNQIISVVVSNTLDDLLAKIPEEFQERILSSAKEMTRVEAATREVVENIYNDIVGRFGEFQPENMKDVVEYIGESAPAMLNGVIINYYKNGQVHPDTYLKFPFGKKGAVPMKEKNYIELKRQLDEWGKYVVE